METTIIRRKSYGRRKIEIKKIEKRSSLQVTFSKRRAGLFRKAAELSVLCGANVAVIVQSPAGKIFATGGGYPINSIIDRYLAGAPSSSTNNGGQVQEIVKDEDEKQQGEIMKKSEAEEDENMDLMETKVDDRKGFWWDDPLDNIDFEELEQYLENLKRESID